MSIKKPEYAVMPMEKLIEREDALTCDEDIITEDQVNQETALISTKKPEHVVLPMEKLIQREDAPTCHEDITTKDQANKETHPL